MNRIVVLCALALSLASVREAPAQTPPGIPPGERPRDSMPRRERVDRVERLKQMRLIEELNLGEDEAVRFMAKRKEHEDRMRALTDDRNAMLENLSRALGSDEGGKPGVKSGGSSIENTVADVLDQDRKMFDERRRYQEEMRKMLPMEKFAKMLVFEREFQMQVRDAMGRSMKKRSSKFDE